MVKQNSPADIRMTSLLEQFHLEDRLINMDAQPQFSIPDYSNIDILLETLRESSKQFLKQALTE